MEDGCSESRKENISNRKNERNKLKIRRDGWKEGMENKKKTKEGKKVEE